jgi:PKD repeat protein
MRNICFLTLLFILITVGSAYSEDSKCHKSTEGKEFWFGFMEGRRENRKDHYIEITITARESTNFNIYTGKSTTPFTTGSVTNNGSVQIQIPLDLAEARNSETIQERGIYLTSEKPVNVYALNWDRNSADVAVIYPVQSLGKEYFTMCFTPNVHSNPDHGRNSEFLVVASEDSTMVKITPSVVTDGGKAAGIPFQIKLNKGEVYQVQSANQRYLTGQGDLTGSYIESDKPVAVYSGNLSTTVPAESGMSGYDHLFEQIPPIQTWGREYYAVPLRTRMADIYRIMAAEDSTTVLIGNVLQIMLQRGESREFPLDNSQPSRIVADKPILVAQFSQSNNTDRSYTGGNGDPFMIILSSVSQSKNDVTFVAYNSSQIRKYFVNVVAPTSEVNTIELDGNLVSAQFKPFAGSNYSYAQLVIGPGTYNLRNKNTDRGFLAYVYGYGGFESYGYAVGFNLDLVLDLGQTINFEGDTLPLCKGSELVLDAGPYFDYYLWSTGDTTQKITVTEEGKYWAQGSTVDGCNKSDSIFILVSDPPKPFIGPDLQDCSPYMVKLDGGDIYVGYVWSTGEISRTIEVDTSGLYHVTAFDKYGCAMRDTMKLTVFTVPVISMNEATRICGSKTRRINLDFTGADSLMIENGKMEWNTANSGKLSFISKNKTSAEITVTDWGEYEVDYKFTTPDGCEVPGKIKLQFFDIPTSDIKRLDDNPEAECAGYSQIIQYEGNATSNARFFWDYGGCTVVDSSRWNQREISMGISTSVPVVKLLVEENGCWSKLDSLKVKANPNFTMNTVKSRGCDSATIYFTGELITPDSLLFAWDFGDGSLVSNVQNPSHSYKSVGSFDVGLVITNQINGCKVGYIIDEMVKIFPTPTAKIELDPAFCNDSSANAIYSLNIDSSFCIWDFDGAHQIAGDNDSITVFLDKQLATIRLQVEEYGCTSQWTETTARRKPFFNFSTDITTGCQPLQVLTTATTADEQLEFSWLTDSLTTTGNEQNFILPDAGEYNFTLASKSLLTGCSDTLTKHDLVLVHPKPLAQFEVDFPVAIIEHANLNFTNLTSGTEFFDWSFGDGGVSMDENPQHIYNAIGKYPVSFITKSEFGCLDTANMEIEIVPFNVFTPNAFRPDSEIPENREFMPVGVGINPDVFQFRVYNRWGEMVFESENPEIKWDGTTKNSRPAPAGNYIWKADFEDIQGFSHSMKGQVLLIK